MARLWGNEIVNISNASPGDRKGEAAGQRLGIVSINPEITSGAEQLRGLHYQIERSVADAARRKGINYAILGTRDATPPDGFPAVVLGVLSPMPFRHITFPSVAWRDEARRHERTFAREILNGLAAIRSGGEWPDRIALYLYHGHPADLRALIRVGLALRGRCRIVLALYQLHNIYGEKRPERIPGFTALLRGTRRLRRLSNVHLAVDSARLAERVKNDTGERIEVLPFFAPAGDDAAVDTSPQPDRIRIVYPTALPSPEKGLDVVLALPELLGRRDVEIEVRDHDVWKNELCLPSLAAFANGLRMTRTFLSPAGYREMLERADLVLVPYPAWQFQTRTSGIVADAVRMGKPMVGTAETWIGDQIEKLGAGTTFRSGDPHDFARAVREALDGLERFTSNVRSRAPAWLAANSGETFLAAISGLPGQTPSGWRAGAGMRLALGLDLPQHVRDAGDWVRHRYLVARNARAGRRGHLEVTVISDLVTNPPQRWRKLPAITWRTEGVERVEVRLDAPDGFVLATGGPRGLIWLTPWITGRRVLFLQDAGPGKEPIPENTLARTAWLDPARNGGSWFLRDWRLFMAVKLARVARHLLRLPHGELSLASPPPGPASLVTATVTWSAVRSEAIEVHVSDSVFAKASGSGSAVTGPWVHAGMTLLLVDQSRPDLPVIRRLLDIMKVRAAPVPDGRPKLIDRLLTGRRVPSQVAVQASAGQLPADAAPAPAIRSGEMWLEPGEWGILPPPSTGEVYLIAAHARAFLERHGGTGLVIFAPPPTLDILRLFKTVPVRGVALKRLRMPVLLHVRQLGRMLKLDYGRAQHFGRYAGERVGFADMYLREVGLRIGQAMDRPRATRGVVAAAAARLAGLGLSHDRLVLLAPTAQSTIPPSPASWARIATVLRERGFDVATNCGPGETPVPGTKAWDGPFSELYATVEIGALLVTARSGICELCSTLSRSMHVLRVDMVMAAFPGITVLETLAENGLPDRATYHTTFLHDDPVAFADRVLAHPDILSPEAWRSVRPRPRRI